MQLLLLSRQSKDCYMFVLRQIQILGFAILFLHIFPMFVIVCDCVYLRVWFGILSGPK
ncbi:hypothetical protein JHK82_021226 [Glycine max]|nr:hypothetical protein JHK82_021226 [Glycine max]